MVANGPATLLLLLVLTISSVQGERTFATAVRGLKKDKGCGSCKEDPSVSMFPMCAELIPTESPDAINFDFELESTCTTSFWENQAPWINGSPLYVAYYPACSCVILAKGCFLPAVSTFAPMYDVARKAGMSRSESIAFATPFVDDECLAYALAFLQQWAKDDNDEMSND